MTFSEFTKARNPSSVATWKHFLRADDGQSAQCKHCSKILQCKGSSTTGIHTHLESEHPETVQCAPTADDGNSASASTSSTKKTSSSSEPKKRKLTDYFKNPYSVELVVARMAALDGASFRFFTESDDLRRLFKNSNLDLPKSPTTISKIIFNQAESVKEELKKTIAVMKENGDKFTLSLDEWTSLRNKRYMNINVHSKAFSGFTFRNLGLVKISGAMPAQVAVTILRDRLAEFNILLEEDVVSHTTDGASVMKKMGTYIDAHHQLCLAHGIQLAVIDTLYKVSNVEEPLQEVLVCQNQESGSDSECDDDEVNSQAATGGFELETPRVQADPRLYKDVIEKVRQLARSIRRSPLKADKLREYVKKEFKENIELKLDCCTRWSSMSEMIGSFLKIKDCIFKLLIDLKSDVSFTETEIATLIEIHSSLEVVKLTVLTLCRRDATLYTADIALRFMLTKLDAQKTYLSSKLAEKLRTRIEQRRLLVAGVLHYLHDSESFYETPDDNTFKKPSSDEICEIIVKLLTRLKYKTLTDTPETLEIDRPASSPDSDLGLPLSPHTLTLEQELESMLQKSKSHPKTAPNFDLSGFVKTEKAMYDNNGERGVYLNQAYKYLSEILPTSVESERVFSSAGYFCTKIRSSLSDDMLNALSENTLSKPAFSKEVIFKNYVGSFSSFDS